MSIYKGTELLAGVATNTIENAHSLLDYKWTDHILNELSWLRADTFSWQSGSVYVGAYNHLVADNSGGTSQTETVGSYTITYVLADDGHKITTDETTVANIYAESGVAWYYILDTVNQRFKLPRENPAREELIQVVKAKGNGITLGLTDGTSNAGLINDQGGNNNTQIFSTVAYGSSTGAGPSSSAAFSGYRNIGVTTDPTKSGIISDMTDSTSVYKGHKYLYFYVGNFSQSATEQTAGLNSSLFNGKADVDLTNTVSNISDTAKSFFAGLGMPSDTYDDLTLLASGQSYTAPANGYFSYNCGAVNAGGYVKLVNTNTKISSSSNYGANGNGDFGGFVPAKKGDSVTMKYNLVSSWTNFVFVYAKGSESEAS